MACGKSLIAAFLVVVTLSSMSSSLGARHLFQTTGQWSTPYTLPGRTKIGILGPKPNLYYLDYAPILPIPIRDPLPTPPPRRYGLPPIGIPGPWPNMYYPADIPHTNPTPTPEPTPTPIPGPVPDIIFTPLPGIGNPNPNPNPNPTMPPFGPGPPPPFPLPEFELN